MKRIMLTAVLVSVAVIVGGCGVMWTHTEKVDGNGCKMSATGIAPSSWLNPNVNCKPPVRETITTTTSTPGPQSKGEFLGIEEPVAQNMPVPSNRDCPPPGLVDYAGPGQCSPIMETKVSTVSYGPATTTVVREYYPEPVQQVVSASVGWGSGPYIEYTGGYYSDYGRTVWFVWEWDSRRRCHVVRQCPRPRTECYPTGGYGVRGGDGHWSRFDRRPDFGGSSGGGRGQQGQGNPGQRSNGGRH